MSTGLQVRSPASYKAFQQAARPFDVVFVQTGEEPAAYPLDHLQPRKGLYSILRRPIFMATQEGEPWREEWNEEPWPVERLASLERNFPLVVGDLHPWVTINHEPPEAAETRMEGHEESRFKVPEGMRFFLGFVSRAYRNTEPYTTARGRVIPPGHLYFNDFVNVAPLLAECIDRGNFLRASIGILEGAEVAGRSYTEVQEHASFEGEWEAVTSLDDLNRWYASHDPGRPGAGVRKTFTSAKGAFQMAVENGTAGAVEMAEGTVPGASGAASGGVETRLANVETAVVQLAEGQKSMSATLQGIAAKLSVEAPAEMGNEQAAEEETVETPAEEVPATVDPATGGAVIPAATLAAMENRVAERVRKQFSAQLQARDQEIARLSQSDASRTKNVRAEARRLFFKKHEAQIEPLLRPLAENIDEALEVADEKLPAQHRRLFHNATTKKSHGLQEQFRLFIASRKPVTEGQDAAALADLDAPPDADLTVKGQEWNGATTHAAITRHGEKVKAVNFSAARKSYLQLLPPAERSRFLRGEGKPASA